MRIAKRLPLSHHYNREEAFSAALSKRESLKQIGLGDFILIEREVPTAGMVADIVAYNNNNEVLVIENQFGHAHWGRLECYAYYHNANMAALIAEDFQQLMIDACRRRNMASDIQWYLISAYIDLHEEHHFNIVVQPSKNPLEIMSSHIANRKIMNRADPIFWQPIRDDKNCIFAGKPVPPSNNYGIEKKVRGTNIYVRLQLRGDHSSIRIKFEGNQPMLHLKQIMDTLPVCDDYEYKDRGDSATATIQVIDKGRKHKSHWDDIRKMLVEQGTFIYEHLSKTNYTVLSFRENE